MTETLQDIIEWLCSMAKGYDPKQGDNGLDNHDMLQLAERIKAAVKPLLDIDLSKTSPLPWRPKAYNIPLADTGDYDGICEVVDANGQWVLAGDGDTPEEREVEIDDCCHDGNCVAAAECVNAINKLQEEFGIYKFEEN